MKKNYKDLIDGLLLLIVMLLMIYILIGCEVSYIYVKGNNNKIEERQTEDVNVKVDSLNINGIKKKIK